MLKGAFLGSMLALLLAVPQALRSQEEPPPEVEAPPPSNPNQPPEHTKPFPNLSVGTTRDGRRASFELAPQLDRGLSAAQILEQRNRMSAAVNALAPQRPGVVDAYVLTIALDSDPVFAREAREAGRVLSARYDGAGRTLVLAGPDGKQDNLPRGSIRSFIEGLAAIAERMDGEEDVLVLYTTSHGSNLGLSYHYGDTGFGFLSPKLMQSVFKEVGIKRRILIVSACYSGVFVPAMESADTAILTAAANNRTSFGCEAENDWTYFGDALINRALRQPQSLGDASRQAARTVAGWEGQRRLLASLPQLRMGDGVNDWLPALEARMPQTASDPVGRPAIGE
ncbi:MAG: C13 family peptidase [Erythrobacter sp.]